MTLFVTRLVYALALLGLAMRLALVFDPPCDRFERYAPQQHHAAAVYML